MDADLRARLGGWFATVAVQDALLPEIVVTFLSELVDMLDGLEPAHLDRGRSAIQVVRDEVDVWAEIRVAHDTHQEAGDILIEIHDDEVIVECLSAVRWEQGRMTEPDDLEQGRPWPMMVVDDVALIIAGNYELERHYRGGRLAKTLIIDVADPHHRRVRSTSSRMLIWRPWPTARRVESERFDYGLRRGR